MKLLAIEASSAVTSIALRVDEKIEVRELATPREQTERLLLLADELLGAAGLNVGALDGIAFGRGPGSFTGLRIAAAVAQGFALASRVPLLPVSSLLCAAQRAWRTERAARSLVCVDARMGEIYWAEFEQRRGVTCPVGDERLGPPASVAAPGAQPWTAVGNAFTSYATELAPLLAGAEQVFATLLPNAVDLLPQAALDLEAGRAVKPAEALPVYLREHTAWRRSEAS